MLSNKKDHWTSDKTPYPALITLKYVSLQWWKTLLLLLLFFVSTQQNIDKILERISDKNKMFDRGE